MIKHKLSSKMKVVIWGHYLHTHTHSYVHAAFFKAFKHLGVETHWHNDDFDQSKFDYSNCLFITEGQVCDKIPVREDCFYVLHNCYDSKFDRLYPLKKCIRLQVYTDAILKYNFEEKDTCIYYDVEGMCLYQPWATDLLPHEVYNNKPDVIQNIDSKIVNWIGTVGEGEFGNIHQLSPFIKACKENNITFHNQMGTNEDVAINKIKESYMAPTIVGAWQLKNGYIPCRIFKNISYGQMGITNSPRVLALFKDKIVQNTDTYALFYDAQNFIKNNDVQFLHGVMDYVAQHHTYLNRIDTIFDFISRINDEILSS